MRMATVAVAGATGWLGGHVVSALTARGVPVLALARPGSDAPALHAPGVTVARCDVTDAGAVGAALAGAAPSALISCVGLRDAAAPDAAVFALLRDGTAALANAARAAGAARFVTVAGGIHRTRDGAPLETMIHNAAREAGLRAARRAAHDAGDGGRAFTITAVDASVFFKDAATLFDMIAASIDPARATASLTLVAGAWTVLCNPISGRDLAAALVACALADAPPPPRVTAGGPLVLTFAALADAAGDALGVRVAHRSLPRWAARCALAAARAGAAVGLRRARGVGRFLTFLWVVATDESPGGLVGEVGGAQDSVVEFFRERARERGVNQKTK